MNTPILITANDDGIRLERYIQKKFPQVPMSMRQKFFRTKKIAVFRKKKRQKIEKNFLLQSGDEVKIFFNPLEFGKKKEKKKIYNFEAILKHPNLKKISILFEDEFFMVVNKPAGIAVHPGSGVKFGHTLIDYCTARIKQKNPQAMDPKPAHRIDKDTSGLVLITKNDGVLRKITQMIRDGKIEKKYTALVAGEVLKTKGTITEKIKRTEGSKYNKITIDNQTGKNSVTHYKVTKFYKHLNSTLLDITLQTGRMHQIRIHFSSLSHPLAGDKIYGEKDWNTALKKKYLLERQFLHASSLAFVHPMTGKKFSISSPLPKELKKVLG